MSEVSDIKNDSLVQNKTLAKMIFAGVLFFKLAALLGGFYQNGL